MLPHEYSVIGHSRALIGRYLGMIAGGIAALSSMTALWLADVAKHFGFEEWVPAVILWPITGTVVYTLVHFAFDKSVWRYKPVRSALSLPDISGEWAVTGKSLNERGEVTYEWEATAYVTQSWEKIKIYQDAEKSESHSISAALIKEPGFGYRLMYSYHNIPKAGHPELQAHNGHAEMRFDNSGRRAEGEYFNNKGRVTFGHMIWNRK
jgi:hypothetical protein